jgi:hypothetical protein
LAIAPTILTPKIRHEVFEFPLPGPNDFKSAESSLLIGPFLTEIEFSLEGGLPQQMTKPVKAMMVKLHL